VPGQKITLDRATILSRLASRGIPAERVVLTGADAVEVRRRQQVISGDEFVSFARLFLQQNPPGSSPCDGTAAVRPKDLALSGEPKSMQLLPKFVDNGASGFVTIQVAVVVDGQEIGSRTIPLRLRYRGHKVVTLQEIPEGTKLTPENVKIEETVSDRPETDWKSPYGLVALRNLPASTEIREGMVDAPQPSLVIRRNETVVIRVHRPGFSVTATGLAMQEGRAGQYVKVRNTDSHRVIMCKVNEDGTVEPLL
jgi:flagella basal body P-ring formation protein FlgA